ncbi:hypothetical protein BCUN_2158 [Bifidobacterium cuniculi]|uniref:Lipoprotein n=1 Tax=Bifidobacterium cuniculi TaxID=1688 RepID=A0A087ADI6_9BIFI|nr:hypothetical protein BCUN_2158 [Bifidobacterium cuniculi]
MTSGTRKLVAALTAGCLLAGMAACGSSGGDTQAQDTDDSTTVQTEGARIATSLSARIEDMLRTDTDMSERQRDILERALANDGVVTKADYELAWSNFQQCLADKGYAPMTTTMYQGGVHGPSWMTDVGDRGEGVRDKVTDDVIACKSSENLVVDELYRAAIGNPSLYQVPEVGVADCLRRKNLVPVSYTAKTYQEDQKRVDAAYSEFVASRSVDDAWAEAVKEYGFDYDDPEVQLCHVANGLDIRGQVPGTAVTWKPFG